MSRENQGFCAGAQRRHSAGVASTPLKPRALAREKRVRAHGHKCAGSAAERHSRVLYSIGPGGPVAEVPEAAQAKAEAGGSRRSRETSHKVPAAMPPIARFTAIKAQCAATAM